ncbi:MAG: exo-alpha-sialidase [Anaerolineae bacterium]|nr:exo-alpha-sialidase [Anaerolineae bacterium]
MRVVDRGVVYDASQAPACARYASFTALTALSDGALVVAFRVGSTKDAPDEDLRVMRSVDLGATWEMLWAGFADLPPGSGWRVRSGGLTEIGPGSGIGVFNTFDRSNPALPLANPETQGTLPSRLYVAECDDWRAWRALREVPLTPHTGALTGRILLLRDDTLALPYESWKGYDDRSPGAHHACLLLSPDGGQTWRGPVVVAHDAAGRLLFWDQRLCVHPRHGRMTAMFWTHDRQAERDVPIHIAWGTADGVRWSAPHATGIAGQICTPLYLEDGRLFAAYVHRHSPPSLRAVLSADDGQTWDLDGELVFYAKALARQESGMQGRRDFGDYWADMNIWTFGHPSAAQLASGEVMVAYYAGDEAALSVHWVRIDLA